MNCIAITQAIVNQIQFDDRRTIIESYEDVIWNIRQNWRQHQINFTDTHAGAQAFRLDLDLVSAFCDMDLETQIKYGRMKSSIIDDIEVETNFDRCFIREVIAEYLLSQGDDNDSNI